MHGFFNFELETCWSRVEDFKTKFWTKGATIFRTSHIFKHLRGSENVIIIIIIIIIIITITITIIIIHSKILDRDWFPGRLSVT